MSQQNGIATLVPRWGVKVAGVAVLALGVFYAVQHPHSFVYYLMKALRAYPIVGLLARPDCVEAVRGWRAWTSL